MMIILFNRGGFSAWTLDAQANLPASRRLASTKDASTWRLSHASYDRPPSQNLTIICWEHGPYECFMFVKIQNMAARSRKYS